MQTRLKHCIYRNGDIKLHLATERMKALVFINGKDRFNTTAGTCQERLPLGTPCTPQVHQRKKNCDMNAIFCSNFGFVIKPEVTFEICKND